MGRLNRLEVENFQVLQGKTANRAILKFHGRNRSKWSRSVLIEQQQHESALLMEVASGKSNLMDAIRFRSRCEERATSKQSIERPHLSRSNGFRLGNIPTEESVCYGRDRD